jgi:hypothetical protein
VVLKNSQKMVPDFAPLLLSPQVISGRYPAPLLDFPAHHVGELIAVVLQ